MLWGCRVVVPLRGRKRALQMLHESHRGMVRISYMWWPGMDKEVVQHVKQCSDCRATRKDPPPVPFHPWTWPEKPWSRIHIDYAGPMKGKMFLLMMDAHSKSTAQTRQHQQQRWNYSGNRSLHWVQKSTTLQRSPVRNPSDFLKEMDATS